MPTNNKVQNIKNNFKEDPAMALGHINHDALNGIIPSKPAWISGWIFPYFAGVLFLLLCVLWFIPHPEIIKTTGVLTGIDANEKTLSVDIAIPDNNLQKINSGQLIQIRFKEQSNSHFGVVIGKLLHISAVRHENNLIAKVLVSQELTNVQFSQIEHNKRLKVNLVIVVKDLRLLQCIFKNPLKK